MRRYRGEIQIMKMIDFIFLNEDKLRDAVDDEKLTRPPLAEIHNESHLSDPTAYEAINNMTPITAVTVEGVNVLKPELWLDVVDDTYNYLGQRDRTYEVAVKCLYASESYIKICTKFNLSIETLYRQLNKARQYAAILAAWHRLINPK